MDKINFDATVDVAKQDHATVTSEGKSLSTVIDGVSTVAPVNHVDHRGRVFEVYAGPSEHWRAPLVYAYVFSVRPGQTKGWGLHEEKNDRYTLISGELLTILYDARAESPTHGVTQKVVLTGEGTRQLLIPQGVWHMNIALGANEVFLINHPTAVYTHGKPDRLLLPWDTDAIPVDVASYFPRQFTSSS